MKRQYGLKQAAGLWQTLQKMGLLHLAGRSFMKFPAEHIPKTLLKGKIRLKPTSTKAYLTRHRTEDLQSKHHSMRLYDTNSLFTSTPPLSMEFYAAGPQKT